MIRIVDIFLSGLSLLIFSPLLIPLAVALRFTGEGEIFFRQKRIGREGKHFGLIKFATMLKDSPNIGTGTVTVKDDPRVLPLGKVLRKAKINELPQLLNIFFGDMAIIGPRPQTQRCFDAFPVNSQKEIIRVRPGLSGIGSIIFRGEEEMMHANSDPGKFYDHMIMPYKGILEEWYVQRQSFWVNIQLIALTMWVVAFPRSGVVWRVFGDLPKPPDELLEYVNWPG